jgi:uncharacterized protein
MQREHEMEIENASEEELLEVARTAFACVRAGDVADLKGLLDIGVPANLLNDDGESLLVIACKYGHSDVIYALLDHGADPALPDDDGATALDHAVRRSDLCTAEILLEAGAIATSVALA